MKGLFKQSNYEVLLDGETRWAIDAIRKSFIILNVQGSPTRRFYLTIGSDDLWFNRSVQIDTMFIDGRPSLMGDSGWVTSGRYSMISAVSSCHLIYGGRSMGDGQHCLRFFISYRRVRLSSYLCCRWPRSRIFMVTSKCQRMESVWSWMIAELLYACCVNDGFGFLFWFCFGFWVCLLPLYLVPWRLAGSRHLRSMWGRMRPLLAWCL